jgi:hypothetical protein
MQGLPIQNLIKMPKGTEGNKTSAKGVLVDSANENAEVGNATNFESLFAGMLDTKAVKNEKQVAIDPNIVVEKKESAEKLQPELVLVKEESLENKIAKSSNGLDQLLNNLKQTEDRREGQTEEVIPSMNKNQLPIKSNEEVESPLDFIVKNAKKDKMTEVKFEGQKLPENLTESNVKAVVSGEDFLNNKNIKNNVVESKLNQKVETFDPQLLALQKNMNLANKVKGYQQGQNVLSDTLIKTNRDLAFKDKKTGASKVDELLNSDMKKSNELSMIKESPFIPVMALKNETDNQSLKLDQNQKVLDLSSVNVANKNELIQKITDYVMQSQVAGKDQIDLTVKHETLGQFQIQVNKMPNQNHIDMQIVANSAEGHKFFVEHEGAIAKSLQQSGIQLSDLRIVSNITEVTANSFAESKQFNSFSQNQSGSQNSSEQHGSFQSFSSGDYRQGKERRNELWNEYRERYGA